VDGEQITRADIEFHAATAHVYEEVLGARFRAHDELVVQPLLDSLRGLAPGDEALDIGCGTGLLTLRLAQRGFRVNGIDHSAAMLHQAQEKVRASGLPDRVILQTGDARSLPFEDESFDLVTCTGVLHHVPDIRPTVVEAHRVLRPGGLLWIAEPCLGTNPPLRLWGILLSVARRLRRSGPKLGPELHSEETLDVPDHEEGPIDAAGLDRLLDECGMERDLTYWSFFRGLHRAGPLWLQKVVIRAGSRPWRNRAGNVVVALARRRRAG
jgi:SAM-dependent methyltransferase